MKFRRGGPKGTVQTNGGFVVLKFFPSDLVEEVFRSPVTITWDDHPTSCCFQQITDNPLAEALDGCKDSRTCFVLIHFVTSLDGNILHYVVDVLNLSQLLGFTAKNIYLSISGSISLELPALSLHLPLPLGGGRSDIYPLTYPNASMSKRFFSFWEFPRRERNLR